MRRIRLDPVHEKVRFASAITGESVSEFLRHAAEDRADEPLPPEPRARFADIAGVVHGEGGRARRSGKALGEWLAQDQGRDVRHDGGTSRSFVGAMRTSDRWNFGVPLARLTIEPEVLHLGVSLFPTERHRTVRRDEVRSIVTISIWLSGEYLGIVAPGSRLHGWAFGAPFRQIACRLALQEAGWDVDPRRRTYEGFRALL
jgi:hypothetical protein